MLVESVPGSPRVYGHVDAQLNKTLLAVFVSTLDFISNVKSGRNEHNCWLQRQF